ncbi:MAG: hypothetical protein IPH57_07445 [Saprospiraceae bacterium]|nr:hypothetical protein [Saprospiraceae bacterium]
MNDGLCIEFAPPPPCVLTVPANMNVAMDPDICGAVVNFTVSASDNCGPVTVTPASGSVFPAGTTTVTVKSGFETKTFTITVNDIVDPVVTCPEDIEVTLDPGLCSRVLNYNVEVSDNCPFLTVAPTVQFPASFENHGNGTVFSLSGNTAPGGLFFNLTNNSGNVMNVTAFGVRFGNPAYGGVNPPQTMQVFSAPTYVGNETNAGAWTSLGPVVLTTIAPYFATGTGTLSQVNLTSQVAIAPGQTRGFFIYGATACPIFNWAFGGSMAPLTNGPWTLTAGSIAYDLFNTMFQTGQISYPNINVQAIMVVVEMLFRHQVCLQDQNSQ